jgi:hypothetical protein
MHNNKSTSGVKDLAKTTHQFLKILVVTTHLSPLLLIIIYA